MEKTLTAFVLMPFEAEFNEIYESLIKQSLVEVGYQVMRADSLLDQRSILREIILGITKADLIVADLTTNNPNVFYELGLCHALRRPTILLAQSINDVPFDLRSYKIHIYDTHFSKIKKLEAFLKEIGKKHRNKEIFFGNPVTDFSDIENSPATQDITPNSLTDDKAEYSRDESLMIRYLKRMTANMTLKSVGASLEGKELSKSLEILIDLNRYREREVHRLGDDAHMLDTLLDAFAGTEGVLRREGTTVSKVFRSGDLMAKVEGALAKAGFKTELSCNGAHRLWEIETTTSTGLTVSIDWNFGNFVEFQKAVELYMALEDQLAPLFVEITNGTSGEINNEVEENELFDFLVEGELAANDLTGILKTVLKDNEVLNSRITRHAGNMQALSNNPTAGSAGRLHKLSLLASSDMNSFSKKLEDSLPTFESTVERLSEAYSGYLELIDPRLEQGQQGLIQLRDSMDALLRTSKAAKTGVHSFREASLALGEKKLSKDLSRASRRQAEALNGLISNIERVEAFSSKILGMINGRSTALAQEPT